MFSKNGVTSIALYLRDVSATSAIFRLENDYIVLKKANLKHRFGKLNKLTKHFEDKCNILKRLLETNTVKHSAGITKKLYQQTKNEREMNQSSSKIFKRSLRQTQ